MCRRLKYFFLIIASILFLLEIALRITGYFYLRGLYLNSYTAKDNDLNIICLGESSTSGLWVEQQDSYPKQLEKKLQNFYKIRNIRIIVPPHVGQNTSQVSNRINSYLELYKPRLIIAMIGCNNGWSLSESNVVKFLNKSDRETLKIKSFILLDNVRVFKLIRYYYVQFCMKDESEYVKQNKHSIWGHPELAKWPPEKWLYRFSNTNEKAFLKMWEFDVRKIIQAAKSNNVRVVLMTYHIMPPHLTSEDFINIAQEQNVYLVRNDKSFDLLIGNDTITDYVLHDKWHPSKKGYSIIANNMFECIVDNNLLGL